MKDPFTLPLRAGILATLGAASLLAFGTAAEACSRILYQTGAGAYITGRSMDWNDLAMQTAFWAFPRGMDRDGGVGEASIKWTSRYGSVVISAYDIATSDGLNEAGVAGNLLYLAESDFGDAADRGKPLLSVGAWLQYLLDNYGSVAEAVAALEPDPFTVVPVTAPNGRPATVHIALSDAGGDSAILEYIGGELRIHHSRDYRVMTNSPTFDQQLAINAYWKLVGGRNFLPGTIGAADRFVRLSYALESSPKFEDRRAAVAAVMSQMRAIGVPLGMSDPDKPNISSTLWRSVIDHDARRYYFDSVINPSVVWVDLDDLDLGPGARPMTLKLGVPDSAGGDVSSRLQPAEPFAFARP
ncbi:linear amide C-N hydrolase [Albimonas pacifica]|uniref:Penicillin amidase Cysteine peptidase. MEROPS family C59 n=1 Tax=Albimonas pacifica TaxID=1114924 RepID=A0A1I3D868_9RHOB|nr:linear amide C-N hydrolase [Albimonas pacifica]SFH82903.1 penicillin amidase Cysteine peptidase. MEROPS family C59 [Albimonas pacifica]